MQYPCKTLENSTIPQKSASSFERAFKFDVPATLMTVL